MRELIWEIASTKPQNKEASFPFKKDRQIYFQQYIHEELNERRSGLLTKWPDKWG